MDDVSGGISPIFIGPAIEWLLYAKVNGFGKQYRESNDCLACFLQAWMMGWLVPGDALNKSVRTELVEVRRLRHKGYDWLSPNGNEGFSLVLS